MPETKTTTADWKQVLFGYVNAVNETWLRADADKLGGIADAGHRNRLAARLKETMRRDSEAGIKPVRSEIRARIEKSGGGSRDAVVQVALHSVRLLEQLGLTWQEERVERERIRFVSDGKAWRMDAAEPLAMEGRMDAWLEAPPAEGPFERRSSVPSVPYLNPDAIFRFKSRVYAGDGAEGGYGPYYRRVPYRREAAVAYAERWWNEPNPGYENFEVNCTNYVSQCVFAGQAPMNYTGRRDSGWWYRGRENGREMWSYSWAVADSLQRYLPYPRASGLRAEAVDSPERLQLGDVICYDWEGNGRFGHNTIVTAFAPDGMPLVNANTVSSRHRYWDYRDSYAWTGRTRYRFFHIVDEF